MKADFLFVCSEKWENMTPNQKGAYCKVCNKEVTDFTKMKTTAVTELLSKEIDGKELCGRFKPAQILELNFSGFFDRFILWNIRKRIAVIFFFVMGGLMFSCSSINGTGGEERLAGTIAIHDTITLHPDTSAIKPSNKK